MSKVKSTEEIRKLPSTLRCAGYLAKSCMLAEYGAFLRDKYEKDEDWSETEMTYWNDICDDLDIYWYALTKEEIAALQPIQSIITSLCVGKSIL